MFVSNNEMTRGEGSVEEALALCVANPFIGSLVVSGPTGCGKSYLVRKLLKQWEVPVVELPLHITEESLENSIDIVRTLHTGKKVENLGLINKSINHIVYIDDIHLLRPTLLQYLLAMQINPESGFPRFTLVGTLNTVEERGIQEFLEKIDLCVQMPNPDKEKRFYVLKKIALKTTDSYKKMGMYNSPHFIKRLAQLQYNLLNITPSKAMKMLATVYCQQGGTVGNDAEIILTRTAVTLAALEGLTYILPRHIKQAAIYVLPHRMHSESNIMSNRLSTAFNSSPQTEKQQSDNLDEPQNTVSQEMLENSQIQDGGKGFDEVKSSNKVNNPSETKVVNENVKDKVEPIGFVLHGLSFSTLGDVDRYNRHGSGKRMLTKSDSSQGRYVRAEPAREGNIDLALDATIRAAAPYQKLRKKNSLAVVIHRSDWRSKVRERRIGRHILFVVDASGSMRAKQRIQAVKGAVLALLQDAYEKRDHVGLIVFRKKTAELILPFTHSVEAAQKRLVTLPTGGRTPLAAGLKKAYSVLSELLRKEPHERPLVVIITDGRATYGISDNPVLEALTVSRELASLPIETLIIDTECEFISFGVAKEIAQVMQGCYYAIDDITEDMVLGALRSRGGVR